MSDVLKGNFKTKKKVEVKNSEESDEELSSSEKIKEELKKKAISSIGGSMVYVEKTDLSWDGDE